MSPTDFALFVALLTRRGEHAWSFEALPPCSALLGVGTGLGYKLNGVSNIHMFPSLSFLLAEIPSRKFMFFYALRNEFLRSKNEFHLFLFSKEIHLPQKTVKLS